MKITDVEVIQLVKSSDHPHRNAKQARSRRVASIVRVTTDEGIDGLGEAWCNAPLAEAVVLGQLKPQIVGQDPFNVEGIWRQLYDGAAMYDPKGAAVAGISGIDMACWDIMGKALGVPVCKLIGGFNRAWIPAYASDLHWQENPADMARLAASFVERGFKKVKTHVGVDPDDDVRRVRALREAIGPDVGLMVDINTAFDRPTAIRFGRRIAEYDITWYEEPLSPMDLDGLAVIRESTGIPIATGENEYTRYGFRDLIATGAVPILNADAKVLGGITEFMKVAALAQAHDLHIAPHGSQDIHVSLVSSISNGLLLEFHRDSTNPLWQKAYKSPLSLNDDGTVSPPEVPGAGIDPNYEVLNQYRVA